MNDIKSYLVRLKANGITSIGTDIMSKELEDMGYSVTPESLVDALANSKYVQKVTVDSIELAGTPMSQDAESKEKEKDKIRKLAVDTAKKKIK